MDIIFVDILIFRQEFCCPCSMLLNLFIGCNIFAFQDIFFQKLQFFFQSCRKNCQTHNLDQTDIFLFDMVILCMRMINTKRIFLCCNIVSQCQIQFKHISDLTCDRCDRIVRFTVCLCKNKCSFVCIASPHFQYMCCQFYQTIRIFVTDTEYRKRPFYDSRFDIFKSWNSYGFLDRSLCHCEGIMSSLEMIMAQDRAANDRKICIGSQEIVREQFYKIKQFDKSISLDLHRSVFAVEYNAVLIVIHIW